MKKYVILALVLVVVGLSGVGAILNVSKQSNQTNTISVILTGFGGKDDTGNWTGESAPILKQLRNSIDVSKSVGLCDLAYEGDLYGSKVLVVVTGMAKVRTSACLTEILNKYNTQVKEVMFVGIGGISTTKKTVLGDVCINSIAIDFDLQHYGADQTNTNVRNPEFWDLESDYLAKMAVADQKLAKEITSASKDVIWPAPSKAIEDVNNLYQSTSRSPKVWLEDECMEVTSDLYWHDIGADKRAREMAAKTINVGQSKTISSDDVVVITSMEAVPVGAIIGWWNKSQNQDIKFAYVRGASNFDHPYLNSNGLAALDARGSMARLAESHSSDLAIQTAALPVLKMFELRSHVK